MEVLLPPLESPHIPPQVPDSCAEPHPADLDDQVSSCSTEPDIPPLLQLQINEPKEPMKIEPDHYYDNSIPVFKPTMEQFQNFDNFIKAIDKWGNQFGIVKVIPPQEWTDNLPDISNRLEKVSIKSPIEQHFSGSSGIFRQDNFELKRTWSVNDWLRVSMSDGHRPPYVNMPKSPAKSRKARGLKKKADQTENPRMNAEPSSTDAILNSKIAEPEFKKDINSTVIIESNADSTIEIENSSECHAKPSIDNVESMHQSDSTKPEDNSHGPPSIPVSNVITQQQPSPPESTLPSPEHKDGEFLPSEADIEVDDQKPDITPKKKSTPGRPKAPRKGGSLDLSTLIPSSPFLDQRYSIRLSPKEYKDLERTYWRTLTFNAPMYGADMLGTLWSDETPSTWNTNNLDGLLSKMGVKLSGVNVPYLYFGMWKATFAWHVEDMDLYSINYLHFGAPKQWYAIPPSQSSKFERFAQGIFPSDHKHCSEFLRHKTFHFSPTMLANHNIKINRMVQEVGEFVITFPHGYHAGYNLGFNCAESVNFASPTWIDIGKQAKSCTCVNDSVKIDVFLWERVWKGETTWDEIYASWMASQETPEQVTPNDEAATSNEETGPKDSAGVGSEMSKEGSATVPKKPKVAKPRKRKEADSPSALTKKSKKVKSNTPAVKVKLNLKNVRFNSCAFFHPSSVSPSNAQIVSSALYVQVNPKTICCQLPLANGFIGFVLSISRKLGYRPSKVDKKYLDLNLCRKIDGA
ncbi:JmjC domain, hydroxylase-domain-containing protein [Paraphysoderma sedebokerense]|nr:JmjC domain, hydroxylase-domain-containing protein [Paraphysoderma sedebokerense]